MASSERDLFQRASRAYELGRFRRAWRATPLIAAVTLCSKLSCNAPALVLGAAAALAILCAALNWRGGVHERAVWPGLSCGVIAASLPFLAQAMGMCGRPELMELCIAACIFGGVLAGVFIGVRASRLPEGAGAFALSAGTVAALAGTLGCVVVGFGGIIGMAAGLALVTTPVFIAARGRA